MVMDSNESNLIEKAEFYRINEIQAHVQVIPKPKFKNGLFASELTKGKDGRKFWWFIESRSSIPIRLFLFEVYNIMDYVPEDLTNGK